ncbi:MAG: 4-hydroxy-tetrahydrodipicolinate synthase [Simkaniaceae bacterium]|nr:4-hydroxy-tetrahydrodipicolinate synthase [Candidatus Sacchlamyda saccharinae]
MLKGSIVALITPFDEFGNLDLIALEKLLAFHKESKTEGLVLCGSTGEGSTLTKDEKLLIFQRAKKILGGKIPLIAATGTQSTRESVDLTLEAKKIGMDGVMAIVPYYVRPTPAGCLAHFQEIAKVGLPMVVYHHPGRTGTKLSARELSPIIEIPEVIALKDATADFALAGELVDQIPHFSGDDSLLLPQLALGFAGSISIVGNIIPREWKEFILAGTKEQFFAHKKLIDALNLETNPQCVKYAVSLLGLCRSTMRLPLLEPTLENQVKIRDACPTAELAWQ